MSIQSIETHTRESIVSFTSEELESALAIIAARKLEHAGHPKPQIGAENVSYKVSIFHGEGAKIVINEKLGQFEAQPKPANDPIEAPAILAAPEPAAAAVEPTCTTRPAAIAVEAPSPPPPPALSKVEIASSVLKATTKAAPKSKPAPAAKLKAKPAVKAKAPAKPKVTPAPVQIALPTPAALTGKVWCDQCDMMLGVQRAAACASKFCKAKLKVAA